MLVSEYEMEVLDDPHPTIGSVEADQRDDDETL
jgi:hypothetical protein